MVVKRYIFSLSLLSFRIILFPRIHPHNVYNYIYYHKFFCLHLCDFSLYFRFKLLLLRFLLTETTFRLKVNRPALRSAARKRSRSQSDGSALSSDSEESTSLIPPVSLEVKFSDQLQRDMISGGLSPLPEEVEESAEERKKDEDVDGAIVFESHELQTDEQSNQVNAVDIGDVKTAV